VIDPFLFGLIAGLLGLVVYAGLVFWAGRKGWWWLAVIVTLPALMGGIMSRLIDMSQSNNPLFQNFGWLVIGQVTIGTTVYFVGRMSVRSSSDHE
jgi:hypothetical protein